MADQEHTAIEAAEEWRPVKGYEGLYWVSNKGRIRTKTQIRQIYHGRFCSRINLYKNRRFTTFAVHRLVLTAFIGPCPEGAEGSHVNGDSTDNRVENLVWETHQENVRRKADHGTLQSGHKNGRSMLSRDEVRVIFTGYKVRHPVWGTAALAKRYGVSEATIRLILMRQRYVRETEDLESPKRKTPNASGYQKGRLFFDRRGLRAQPRSVAADEAPSPLP